MIERRERNTDNDTSIIEYRLNGFLHNPSSPAFIWKASGACDCFLFGKQHRYYGYHQVGPDSSKGNWYIHGELIT